MQVQNRLKSKENNIQRQIHHDSPSGCYERLKWYEISFFGGVVAAVVGGFTFFTNLQSSSSSKPFFFFPERHCTISPQHTHTLSFFSLSVSVSLSLLPRHCNPIRAGGNSHACFPEGMGGLVRRSRRRKRRMTNRRAGILREQLLSVRLGSAKLVLH